MLVAATPRGLPDPGPPPVPQKTLSRWAQFLGSIAAGVLLPDAMLKHYITRADIEAAVRSSAEERQRWDEARLAALKRGWSAFDFEDVFGKIAGGDTIRAALEAVKGTMNGDMYSAFNRIIIADSVLHEMYLAALKARSLVMGEEIVMIADDDSKDMAHNEKGDVPNNAAVNRSKLRVETRARLMSAWNTKMFGEAKGQTQVNVQVNYAEKLEEARARATVRSSAAVLPALTPAFIEAAFAEIPQDQDLSWLDEPAKDPPIDTAWLEAK